MHETRKDGGEKTSSRFAVVILSTADFRSPVWTNKQHLAWGLAEAGFDVHYVESLGLRQPTASRHDLVRIFRKVRSILSPNSAEESVVVVPPNLHIVSPIVVPFHRFNLIRKLNRLLIRSSVVAHLPRNSDLILWTFSPLTYGLEQDCIKVIYHSVDLLHTIPGLPAELLLAEEKKLLDRAQAIIASSSGVSDHLESVTDKDVLLWENVASTELFSDSIGPRKHRVIFGGNLTPTKINLPLIQQLVDSGIQVALAGPIGIDGSQSNIAWKRLLDNPLVEFLGNLSLQELAEEVGRSKVGIIPYFKNEYTRGVFPMKVYEYLSGGLDVIATEIESLRGSSIPGLTVTHDDEFCVRVSEALSSFSEQEAAKRSSFASSKSWRNRVNEATNLLDVVVKE